MKLAWDRFVAQQQRGPFGTPSPELESFSAGYRLGFEAAREAAAKVADEERQGWLDCPPEKETGLAPVMHPAQTCYELTIAIRAIPLPGEAP